MVIAANIEVDHGESTPDEISSQESMQIEQVTLPPQTPPEVDSPPDEIPVDTTEPDPDSYAAYDPPTPDPTPEPTPEVTPEPEITPEPEVTPEPDPTPGETAEPVPTPTPTPIPTPEVTPTPNPESSLPPQFAKLPESEQNAARAIKKYLEEQGNELPDELPFGFDNWEQYATTSIGPEFEAKARKLGQLPDATRGANGPSTSESPAPGASPGTSDGNGDNSSGSGFKFRIPGAKKDDFDPNLNGSDLKNPKLNGDLENEKDLFGNKTLDDLTKTKDLEFDASAPLTVPTPSPIPLPSDINTGDLGNLLYLSFKHDNLNFKAQWPPEDLRDKKVTVQYYPPANPEEQKGFDLPWQDAFNKDHKNIVQAILQVYQQRKEAS